MPSKIDVHITLNAKNGARICMAVRPVFARVEKWFWVTNEWYGKVEKERDRVKKQQLQRP
jgi:hypothetical protein